MLKLDVPAWNIALRTAAIYLVALIGLRLAGKREIGQMTVLAAVVLLVLNAVVARLRLRWPRLRRLVEGSPTLLVLHGEVLADHLRREGLDEETLQAALREHGVAEVRDVEMAVLEIDGSISVVPAGGTTTHVKRPVKYLRHQ
jgi:uncharacterized membrane protein YcaP (DUF421 family)